MLFSRSYRYTLMIDYLASYCLSGRSSMTLYIVALRVGVGGWKLYRPVPRMALHIHFFRHFCCRMYRSARTHSENFRLWNNLEQHGHDVTWPLLFQTRRFRRLCSAAIMYVVRSTIGLLSNSYASCCVNLNVASRVSKYDDFVIFIVKDYVHNELNSCKLLRK